MRGPSRTRTQPLAAVLVLESDPAGRCCGAAPLVDDSKLGGMSSPLPGLSEYEYRFAEYEYEYEYDVARSIDARSGMGKATGPTNTTRYGHWIWSQIGLRLGRS